MTVSLTVIIIEATGDVAYGLPIMLAIICAKWTGDYLTEGTQKGFRYGLEFFDSQLNTYLSYDR